MGLGYVQSPRDIDKIPSVFICAGNKIYGDLRYHKPEAWQAALDGQVEGEDK